MRKIEAIGSQICSPAELLPADKRGAFAERRYNLQLPNGLVFKHWFVVAFPR